MLKICASIAEKKVSTENGDENFGTEADNLNGELEPVPSSLRAKATSITG